MHRFQGLLRRFGSPEHVLNASLTDLMTVPGLGPQIACAITTHRNHAFVTRQLKLARRHGVDIITSHDEAYPASLRQIYDPPPLLFVRGRVTEVDGHVLGIVGTRRVSSYGRWMTERFCSALCAAGITIVSGLARGVDTIAHRTALAQKGRTVAVLVRIGYPIPTRKPASYGTDYHLRRSHLGIPDGHSAGRDELSSEKQDYQRNE